MLRKVGFCAISSLVAAKLSNVHIHDQSFVDGCIGSLDSRITSFGLSQPHDGSTLGSRFPGVIGCLRNQQRALWLVALFSE